jgi:P22 coat protein - gene protein 5
VSQSLLSPQVISNELLRRFINTLGFAKAVHTENYSDHFGKTDGKIGDTFNLRDPVRFAAIDGARLVLQDVEERKIPLVINERKHSAFSFTSAERALTIDRIGQRYIEGTAVALANAAEVSGLSLAYQQTPNVVGTPGAGVPAGAGTGAGTAFYTYMQAGEALDRNSAPMDGERFMVIGPKFQTNIIDALKGLFQSTEQIKRQYMRGRMGTAAGFDWMLAQNIRTATTGIPGGTPVVNGAGQSGSSLVISGLAAAGTYVAGDVVTLGTGAASVYAVNTVSLDTLSDLRQFTILNNATADGSGNVTINIYPPIAVVGDPLKPNPYATCSQTPPTGAAVTFWATLVGGAAAVSPQSLAFHKEAYAWACVPMDLPQGVDMAKRSIDKDTGISTRTVSQYDIFEDIFATRADILYGWVAPRKDWGCRIAG